MPRCELLGRFTVLGRIHQTHHRPLDMTVWGNKNGDSTTLASPSRSTMPKRKRTICSSTRRKHAPKKITVGRQPICPKQTIKLIDPVWMPGPVPSGFWNDPVNRRNYMY